MTVRDLSPDADAGVQIEQPERDRWIVDVELPGRERPDDGARQCVRVDLQADRQRRGGRDCGDRFMEPERIRPELLIAERIEAEDLLAIDRFRSGGRTSL